MARKHNQEQQKSAVHKATVMGMPLKQVAEETGVSLSTLRRWIKAQSGTNAAASTPVAAVACPTSLNVVLLDQEGITPKIERILNNEGFQPGFMPLAQHALRKSVADTAPWLAQAQIAELPLAGIARLINLLERSGKDVPLLFITASNEFDPVLVTTVLDYACVTTRNMDRLSGELDRLSAQRAQRSQLCECQLQFKQLQQCCYQVFDAAPNPVAILSRSGHVYANPAYMQLFGHEDFTSLNVASLPSLLSGEDADSITAILARADDDFTSASRDIAVRGGKMRVDLMRFPGVSQGVQVILKPLNVQAPQTGLLSRQEWLLALKHRGITADLAPAALFYIRILGLDQLQKAIGYARCDTLLADAVEGIKALLPEQTLISQFENNVITAVVHGGEPVTWKSLASKLHAVTTDRVFKFSDLSLRLRLTIGICHVDDECKDSERLITWAAEAAGRAEHRGGVGVYQQVAEAGSDDHALWVGRVAKALKDDNLFSILYQPIVNLNGGSDACYEALLRMHNEGGGEYLPGKFMPSAQQAGLMGFIDRWVIRHTCKLIKAEAAQGRCITMFVNISRDSLVSDEFCTGLAQLISTYQINPKSFVFEVSESDLMLYGSHCEPILSGTRSLGCAITVDHFSGTEAAFSLLESLEVDFIKLDGALVRCLSEGRAGRERIAGLAHDLTARGIQSIAGCVQDAESVAQLWQCGVNYVQGYFLQHPSKALDYDFLNDDHEVTASGKS